MLKKFKQLFFERWFPHWSPDAALRYLPIVKLIRSDPRLKTVLDVGSGTLGITPYLKRRVVGVDVGFVGPQSSLLSQVKGTADKLPFAERTFDVVLCVDVLEHLPKTKRSQVICELLRVARKKVFIVVPCSSVARNEDLYFYHYFKRVMGKNDPFLKEHLKYGLPEVEEMVSLIPSQYQVTALGNVSLWLHRLVLLVQFSNYKLMHFISSVVFILFLPIFSLINFPPTYRTLFIIDKEKGLG